jgi:tetratricopeptide (TPR) repeat protein
VRLREQTYYIIGALVLLAVLYFGFSTKPSSQKALEKSRALNTSEFDIRSLANEARPNLKEDELTYLETLETQLNHVSQDTQKLRLLKELSGFWYALRQPILAGLFAREAASFENSAQSWSIAGTTFASTLQQKELEEKKLSFARDEAIDAFEKAISLEPSVIEHRVNQALCYIEAPLQDTPMKGIQMLAGLATSYPESPLPPYHLARLALRTGQHERAAERIEQAMKLDPENPKMACLAIDIYTALQQGERVQQLKPLCAQQQ